MNNKVFISGKITGNPNYAFQFVAAEVQITKERFFDRHGDARLTERYGHFGFVPINPCRFTFLGAPLELWPWLVCMAVCLWHLLGCSYVYMLRNWWDSKGARIEHKIATLLGKKIIYQQRARE